MKEPTTLWSWAVELTDPDRPREEISRTFFANVDGFIGILTKYTDKSAPTIEYFPQNPHDAIDTLRASLRKFMKSPDDEEGADLFSYLDPHERLSDPFDRRPVPVGPDYRLDYPEDYLRFRERMRAMREAAASETRPVLRLVSAELQAA
ncbi:hypothetical protein KY385_00350 [Candidatus Parcubacteria bacterium]|nr:hypothetical protein [Candidatus Parcubacteria bacterium]